jgi:hypothetical protein
VVLKIVFLDLLAQLEDLFLCGGAGLFGIGLLGCGPGPAEILNHKNLAQV